MIDAHEPRNGDFVAYLDRLQRESAARLASPPATIASLPTPAEATAQRAMSAADSFNSDGAPERTAPKTNQPLPPVKAARPPFHLLGAALMIVVGASLLLQWLFSGRSGFLFVAGIVLVFWGITRLRALLANRSRNDLQVGREQVVRWLTAGKRR